MGDTNGTVSTPAVLSFNVGLTIDTTTARSLVFSDAGGSKVTVSLSGVGTGQVFFTGSGYIQTLKNSQTVSGAGLGISALDLTETTAKTSLTISRKGASATALGALSVAGSMNKIIATTSVLTGALSVSGTLSQLQLLSISGATITIGSAGTPLTFVAGHVVNTSLTSAEPIKTLKVIDWTNSGTVDSITAPSINSVAATGNFQANLTITGGTPYSLNSVRIGGQVAADTWSITGASNSIVVGSIAAGWVGNFTGINGFSIRAGGFAGTLTAGTVGSLSITGSDTGSITAASIRAAKIVGQLNDATLKLTNGVSGKTQSLGRLTVTGESISSAIDSAGSIGAITTAGIDSTLIDAGVASGFGLPANSSNFTAAASIGSFTVTGRGSTFADTSIAASAIGSLSLGEIITASSTIPFGIGAGTIKSLSAVLDTGGKLKLSGLLLESENSVATYVAANNLTLNSFVIEPGI